MAAQVELNKPLATESCTESAEFLAGIDVQHDSLCAEHTAEI